MKPLREKVKELFSPPARFAENDELDVSPETGYVPNEIATADYTAAPHAEVGELQNLKSTIKGHGEQTLLPDECQYGDNDLCYVEA